MAVCLLLFGCQKEGVYNPSKKIKRVYTQEQGYPRYLNQEWSWDKNHLAKIDYFYGGQLDYTEHYKYDKQNRIVRIEDYYYGDYWTITYNKNGYDRIDYFWKGIPEESYQFEYKNNKISRVNCTFFDYKSTKTGGFRSMILPKEIAEKVCEKQQTSATKSMGYATVTFEYEGSNVIKMQLIDGGAIDTYTYSDYDQKLNPLYASMQYPNLGNFEGMTHYSKNNPGRTVNTWNYGGGTGILPIDYIYNYDGNYPIEITKMYIEGIYTYRITTFYDYQ